MTLKIIGYSSLVSNITELIFYEKSRFPLDLNAFVGGKSLKVECPKIQFPRCDCEEHARIICSIT